MNERVLLDTSAWIIAFRKKLSLPVKEYIERLLSERRVVVIPPVILELLSGLRNQKEYDELYEDISALEHLEITADVWKRAYKASFNLRRRGFNIPFMDIIVASVCLNYDCQLVHRDNHYELIKKYYPLSTHIIE